MVFSAEFSQAKSLCINIPVYVLLDRLIRYRQNSTLAY